MDQSYESRHETFSYQVFALMPAAASFYMNRMSERLEE